MATVNVQVIMRQGEAITAGDTTRNDPTSPEREPLCSEGPLSPYKANCFYYGHVNISEQLVLFCFYINIFNNNTH